MDQDLIQTAALAGVKRLYHYQSANIDYLEDLLLKNRVKFSNPGGFNDPWDCKPHFSKSILDDSTVYQRYVEYAIDLMRRQFGIPEPELDQRREILEQDRDFLEGCIDELSTAMHQAILTSYRVYCLGTDADNFLMWAHYADSHFGVCVGFDTQSELFCGALRVNYLTSYPAIDFSSEDEAQLLHDTLLIKSRHWRYENEFRVIAKEAPTDAFIGLVDGFAEIEPETLTSITLGCNADDAIIEEIKNSLRRRESKPDLFQVQPAAQEYRLVTLQLPY